VALKNPVAFSEDMMVEAQGIYMKFCSHCHGEKGDGKGQIALNGKIEGIPDYKGNIKTLPEGKIFHSISYGKNAMGPHNSLLSKEERW
jgi:cytochrome c